MEEKREVTIEELLKIVVQQLSEIKFPALDVIKSVELAKTVGVPVSTAIENLNVAIQVIEKSRKKQEESEINIEPVDELPENIVVEEAN